MKAAPELLRAFKAKVLSTCKVYKQTCAGLREACETLAAVRAFEE